MNTFKNAIDQLQLAWRQASLSARIVFIATAVVCIALIAGVGIWSSRPQYVPLASDLDPNSAAEIVSKLEAEGIDNKLDFSGSTVSVAHADIGRARLAAGEHLSTGTGGFEVGESSFMDDPVQSRNRLIRRREQALARSIMTWRSVASATVHIAKAESTPFVREKTPTTASVVIDVRPGAAFTADQATAVVAMVAGSVEDLTAEHVTVTDTHGRILYAPGMDPHNGIDAQPDYQRKIESERAAKAEQMLARMLGDGRAIVRVTADIDFTKKEREEKIYDPNNQAVVQETTLSESTTGNARGPQGVTGFSGDPAGGTGGSGSNKKKEESTRIVESGMRLEKTAEASGQIKRLTIAAIVDLSPPPQAESETDESAEPAEAPPIATKEQVEAIIKQAVGFDQIRNDKVEVLVGKLTDPDAALGEELATADTWALYTQLLRHGSLGLASLVAAILGLMIIRKLRPVGGTSTSNDWAMAGRARALAEISQQARQNPEAVAKVLASWLNEPVEAVPDEPLAAPAGERRAA